MVVGLSGHPGIVVLRLVVWAHIAKHELAQILLQKEVGLIALAPVIEQRAATQLHVQVKQKNIICEYLAEQNFDKLATNDLPILATLHILTMSRHKL